MCNAAFLLGGLHVDEAICIHQLNTARCTFPVFFAAGLQWVGGIKPF